MELSGYNPQSDMFISGQLRVELPPTGGFLVSVRFDPFKLELALLFRSDTHTYPGYWVRTLDSFATMAMLAPSYCFAKLAPVSSSSSSPARFCLKLGRGLLDTSN